MERWIASSVMDGGAVSYEPFLCRTVERFLPSSLNAKSYEIPASKRRAAAPSTWRLGWIPAELSIRAELTKWSRQRKLAGLGFR
jgi:hypothetical protein